MEAATALSCTLLPAIEPVLLVSWHKKAGLATRRIQADLVWLLTVTDLLSALFSALPADHHRPPREEPPGPDGAQAERGARDDGAVDAPLP
jgi:hypothetical protein